MSDVLPTLWSPRSTIFVRFNVPEDMSPTGVVGVAIVVEVSPQALGAERVQLTAARRTEQRATTFLLDRDLVKTFRV